MVPRLGSNEPSRLEVLQEIEDVIRSMPPRDQLHWDSDDVVEWQGRASAAIERWGHSAAVVGWRLAMDAVQTGRAIGNPAAKLVMILHQARHDLRMGTVGPVNLLIQKGYVFDYHDEMRKIVEQAKTDLLFVDRYLNGDFVSKFLAYVSNGTAVRLLAWDSASTNKHLVTLIESSKAFSQQHGIDIEIRVHKDIHDRYVFVDERTAFSSGPSFKDGPTSAGATIVEQLGSTLKNLIGDYQTLWNAAAIKLKRA